MTEQPQTDYSQHPSAYRAVYPNPDSNYQKPAPAPQPKRWKPSPTQAIAAGAAVIALMCGIAIGNATAPDKAPAECAVALDYSEEALDLSADGFGVVSEALGGGYIELGRAARELDPITKDLKRITPLYQDARSACLK